MGSCTPHNDVQQRAWDVVEWDRRRGQIRKFKNLDEVKSMISANALEIGDEHAQVQVAGAFSHPTDGRVDVLGARFDGSGCVSQSH